MIAITDPSWVKVENENEWRRGNWVIRFFGEEVELYENVLEDSPGKYFCGNVFSDQFKIRWAEIHK